ncbi:uncharacterized protein LOC135816021 [Sycon ciliatum]|uniref:uncharacterized protein LOC135816021 n=1 Tax=Sycon ciliatum TaxID=27933 RepID=UPI0031F653C0
MSDPNMAQLRERMRREAKQLAEEEQKADYVLDVGFRKLRIPKEEAESQFPELRQPVKEYIFDPPRCMLRNQQQERERKHVEKAVVSQRMKQALCPSALPVGVHKPTYLHSGRPRWDTTAGQQLEPRSGPAPSNHRQDTVVQNVHTGSTALLSEDALKSLRSNKYDMKLLSGTKPFHTSKAAGPEFVVLDGNLQYRKHLQPVMPMSPRKSMEKRTATETAEGADEPSAGRTRGPGTPHCSKGPRTPHGNSRSKEHTLDAPAASDTWRDRDTPDEQLKAQRRWVDLPSSMEDSERATLKNLPSTPSTPSQSSTSLDSGQNQSSSQGVGSVPTPGLPCKPPVGEEKESRLQDEFQYLMRQWCSKWRIPLGIGTSTVHSGDDILQGMINNSNQLEQCRAVSLCAWPSAIDCSMRASAASTDTTGERRPDKGSETDTPKKSPAPPKLTKMTQYSDGSLSQALVNQLNKLLLAHNTSNFVRISAFLALCATKQQPSVDISEPIMNQLLDDSGRQHRWLGAQCAALISNDSSTIAKLFHELFDKLQEPSQIAQERALHFMSFVSERSPLVRLMSTSYLNSQSNDERLAACRLIPRLAQKPTLDVAHKLVYLYWHDSSLGVRTQATRALLDTGHGKLIHDEIWSALMDGDEQEKIAALEKMASCNIMSERLRPLFLRTFKSPHMSVRMAAVNTAGTLRVKDDMVVRRVMNQMVEGTSKLKLMAYEALCLMRPPPSADLLNHMEWAVHLELDPYVKARACLATATLCPKHPPVIAKLKALLEADEEDFVKESAAAGLLAMGEQAEPDRREMKQITQELDEMTSPDRVVLDVLRMDRREKALKDTAVQARRLKLKRARASM